MSRAEKKPWKKPCVTIFTDASVRPLVGRSGWGAVVLRDGARYTDSSTFHEHVSDVVSAELMAAANGLWLADSYHLLDDQPIVVLQTDSLGAIRGLLGSNPAYRYAPSRHVHDTDRVVPASPRSCDARIFEYINCLHQERGFVLMLRHVKGHRKGNSRHGLNGLVDRLARAASEGSAA